MCSAACYCGPWKLPNLDQGILTPTAFITNYAQLELGLRYLIGLIEEFPQLIVNSKPSDAANG